MATAITAAYADDAGVSRQSLQKAANLVDASRFSEAKRVLEDVSAKVDRAAPPTPEFYRLKRLTAECLHGVGDHAAAARAISACLDYLAHNADSSDLWNKERIDVLLLAAAIHEARGESGPAQRRLERALAINGGDILRRVELLARLCVLAARSDGGPEGQEWLRRSEEIMALVESQHHGRDLSPSQYDRAVSAHATALMGVDEELDRKELRQAAISWWGKLAEIHGDSADYVRLAEVSSQLAELYQRDGDPGAAAEWIARAADSWRRHERRLRRAGVRNRVSLVVARTRLASSLRSLSRAAGTTDELFEAESLLQQSIIELRHDGPLEQAENRTRELALLAVLRELRSVNDALAAQSGADQWATNRDRYELNLRIHNLTAELFGPSDPRVYRAKVRVGAAAGLVANELPEAERFLREAIEHWEKHMPKTSSTRHELANIATLHAGVQRELAWQGDASRLAERLSRARTELDRVASVALPHVARSPSTRIEVMLSLGRLAFESGDYAAANAVFSEAERLARSAEMPAAQLKALKFKRSAQLARLPLDQALATQRRINALVDEKGTEADQVDGLLALAGIELGLGELDSAGRTLAEAARACPPDRRSQVEALEADHALLTYQRAVRSEKRVDHRGMQRAKAFWRAQADRPPDAEHSSVDAARALHQLSRARFVEWIAARRRWRKLYEGPMHGRSEPYEVRRNAHEKRCEEYQADAAAYAASVASGRRSRGLVDEEKQLRLEYTSLKTLGKRLEQEHAVRRIRQSQIASRADRDLTGMLADASTLANRAVHLLDDARATRGRAEKGPILRYDASFHYLALANSAEIAVSALTAQRREFSVGGAAADEQRKIERSITALRQAEDLASDSGPRRLGTGPDPYEFRQYLRSASATRAAPTEAVAIKLFDWLTAHPERSSSAFEDRLRRLIESPVRVE